MLPSIRWLLNPCALSWASSVGCSILAWSCTCNEALNCFLRSTLISCWVLVAQPVSNTSLLLGVEVATYWLTWFWYVNGTWWFTAACRHSGWHGFIRQPLDCPSILIISRILKLVVIVLVYWLLSLNLIAVYRRSFIIFWWFTQAHSLIWLLSNNVEQIILVINSIQLLLIFNSRWSNISHLLKVLFFISLGTSLSRLWTGRRCTTRVGSVVRLGSDWSFIG